MKWEDITPDFLTYQQAGEVFMLRVFYGYTWRAIAYHFDKKWDGDWDEIQAAGEDICDAAAKKLGMNPNEHPWN